MPEVVLPKVVRKMVALWIPEHQRKERGAPKTDEDGYAKVEVSVCEGCGHRGQWDNPDYFVHDALCIVRLTDEDEHRTHVMERDREKVLHTIFERGNLLLGLGNHAAHRALAKLYEWQVDDDEQPFLSEAYLYPLLGKEDARTLLALVRAVAKAVGYTPGEGS